MNTRVRHLRRAVTVLLLGMVLLAAPSQRGYAQFGIGLGDDDVNIDIFQLGKTVKSASEARRGFTYEQEYYLGRAIAANILDQYDLYKDAQANRYVTLVGQTVAAHSDLPQTFGGYRFFILDSDEVNALAAPGGIIFITRGMLRACENEDQLAAVLAHEVAHVQNRHGIDLIKNSRWKKFGTEAVFLAAGSFGGGDIAAAVGVFGDMVKDITNQIMKKGYGKKLEKIADADAVIILTRAGYEPNESVTLMQNMQARFVKGNKDFSKTHPKPKDRVKTIEKALKRSPDPVSIPEVRVDRLVVALSRAIAR